MEHHWTVQGLADWAVGVGLQPNLLNGGQGVMLSQPGDKRSIFAIYLPEEGDYLVEVGFNPANEQSWLLKDLLQSHYDTIEVEEGSRKWPRIGLVEFSKDLLDRISVWADEHIRSAWTPAPQPVTEAAVVPEPLATTVESATAPPPAPAPPPQTKAEAGDKDTKLSRWLTAYFATRGMTRPDGRALYAYKTTNAEFEKITKQLQIAVVFRGHKILKKDWNFAALFVLFAAEWWRREYRGGSWTWLPIYQAITLSEDDITRLQTNPQALLYPALERGFRFWKRKVFSMGGGRTFIGSIAAEGGLPLNLLSDTQAGLKRYFRHVLDRYLPLRAAGVPASQVASELSAELPASFRRDQVYRVVGDIVEATLDLRARYGLSSQDDPVKHLDMVCSDWREQFPLSLDNEPAQALLSDLMVTAAKSADTAAPLALVRYLTENHDNSYSLNAMLEMPRKLSTAALASVFGELEWPSVVEIWLARPFKVRLAVCSRTDKENYRVRSDGVNWHGVTATSDAAVCLFSFGHVIGEERSLKESVLEPDMPWVFVENDNRLVFLGQGGMRLAAEQATLCVPAGAQFDVEQEPPEPRGILHDVERVIYQVSGAVRLRHDDDQFSISTKQPKLEVAQYRLTGQRLYRDANIRQIFVGAPRLYCRDLDGPARNIPASSIQWRPVASGATWRTWTGDMHGVVEIKVIDGAEVLFRSRVAVLPAGAEFRTVPGEDENSGVVIVAGLPGVRLAVNQQGVDVTLEEQHDGTVRLRLQRQDESLSAFRLDLQWPDMPKALQVVLPMPVAGARFGAADGHWLPDRAFVAVADLAGVHAIGFNHLGGAPEQFSLDISIRARDLRGGDLRTLSDRVPLPRSGELSELPLIQLRERFLQWFSLSEDLDCQIELALDGHRVYRRLHVGRYAHQLSAKENTVALESAQYRGVTEQSVVDALELEVKPLLDPVERGYVLKPCTSEGVRTGDWYKPQMLAPGPWLVMPGRLGAQSVRPTIFAQPGYQRKEDGRLRDAIAIAGEKERQEAIADGIRCMVGDYGHKDWRLVFETLEAFKHLPATTLDLWDCFARSPKAMAMLLICADSSNYQDVIDLAGELPFVWELVPMSAWFSAVNLLKGYVQESAPEGIAESLVQHAVKQKLGFMLDADPILERPAKLLAAAVLGFADDEIRDAALFSKVPGLINQVLAQASADLRNRQSADAYWPVAHGEYLAEAREGAPEQFSSLFTRQAAYMTSVLQAPVALAVRSVVQDVSRLSALRHADLYALQQIRQFDDTWYQEAFGLTLIYAYATGAMNDGDGKTGAD